MPSHVPTQIIPAANSTSRPIASPTCQMSVCARQPVARPVPSRIAIASRIRELGKEVAEQVRRAGGGSDRKRSMTPSCRSVAIAIAGPNMPNASVCMRMPPIRYSR